MQKINSGKHFNLKRSLEQSVSKIQSCSGNQKARVVCKVALFYYQNSSSERMKTKDSYRADLGEGRVTFHFQGQKLQPQRMDYPDIKWKIITQTVRIKTSKRGIKMHLVLTVPKGNFRKYQLLLGQKLRLGPFTPRRGREAWPWFTGIFHPKKQ